MYLYKILRHLLIVAFAILTVACTEDQPENPVQFKSSQLILNNDQQEVTVVLLLERPAENNTPITLNMQSDKLTHQNQFMIEPESVAVNGTIFLAFAKGDTEASFKVRKLGTPSLEGDEVIYFNIATVQSPIVAGHNNTAAVIYQ